MPDHLAGPRLDHVGLSVADLAAAESWYAAAFGYRRELDVRVEPLDLDIVMLIHPEHGDDLDVTYDRVVALGARPVLTPRPSPEPGVRMAFVADPEGNLVELLDRGDQQQEEKT